MARLTKTLKTARPSFSVDGSLLLKAPRSWAEMTQEQLHYALLVLATFGSLIVAKTYMFFRFTGIEVVKKDRFGWMCRADGRNITITAAQVESLLGQFGYVDSYENMGVRLEDIDGFKAVDVLLHGVRFIEYLNAEKLYQIYQQTQDEKFIERLACVLYRDEDGKPAEKLMMDKAEILGTLLWFAWVKEQLALHFPNFFKPAKGGSESETFDVVTSMNVQIRALTDGDVTKEKLIHDIPCWRALTELDFKAKEAEEFRKKYGKT